MSREPVLVGICTHNRAPILPVAIRSALSQECDRLRVAVVDDASSDATPEIAAQFPGVSWTRFESNRGLIDARNFLMNLPGAEFFVSLDDDAWFLSGDEIETALQVMRERPQVAAVAFDILSPARPGTVPRRPAQPAAMYFGCGHVLRLSAVRSVGLYEKVPGNYGGEEKDLCLRLIDAGHEIVFLPGVHVWHDKTTLARNVPAQHSSGVCNDLVMTLRRTPLSLLPFAVAVKLHRHFVVSRANGLVRPFWRGCRLFLGAIPVVWKSRMPVRMETLRTFMRLSRPASGAPE